MGARVFQSIRWNYWNLAHRKRCDLYSPLQRRENWCCRESVGVMDGILHGAGGGFKCEYSETMA